MRQVTEWWGRQAQGGAGVTMFPSHFTAAIQIMNSKFSPPHKKSDSFRLPQSSWALSIDTYFIREQASGFGSPGPGWRYLRNVGPDQTNSDHDLKRN